MAEDRLDTAEDIDVGALSHDTGSNTLARTPGDVGSPAKAAAYTKRSRNARIPIKTVDKGIKGSDKWTHYSGSTAKDQKPTMTTFHGKGFRRTQSERGTRGGGGCPLRLAGNTAPSHVPADVEGSQP